MRRGRVSVKPPNRDHRRVVKPPAFCQEPGAATVTGGQLPDEPGPLVTGDAAGVVGTADGQGTGEVGAVQTDEDRDCDGAGAAEGRGHKGPPSGQYVLVDNSLPIHLRTTSGPPVSITGGQDVAHSGLIGEDRHVLRVQQANAPDVY